jgi:putative spermidine/putrescine transport system permease protein
MSGRGGTPPFGPLGVVSSLRLGGSSNEPQRRWRPWRLLWWLVFILGMAYFILPLLGTFAFSMKDKPFGHAYTSLLDNGEFISTMTYSVVAGLVTILISTALVVPTAFWVRLRLPRLRPVVEFLTLLPFVVPPIVLVFGLIGTYSPPPLSLTGSELGSDFLLVAAYVVLSLPYMYRAVDTGLAAIDVRSLTEAAQSLGAGWFAIIVKVILPNVRIAVLSGAFLTLAIVIGEFTIATYLARRAFAPFLGLLGNADPFQQAALALVSFGLTWIAMVLISYIGRGQQSRISVTGAR